MKLTLEVILGFCRSVTRFEIENPPTMPCEGETFKAEWRDYISNEKVLATIEQLEQDSLFQVEILQRRYSKEKAEVTIVLHTIEDYEEYCKGR